VLEEGGFGPGYRAFTHRLGHASAGRTSIPTWCAATRFPEARKTFTNEPGIYLHGEMGIRHEDVMVVTEDGASNLTKWSGSPRAGGD